MQLAYELTQDLNTAAGFWNLYLQTQVFPLEISFHFYLCLRFLEISTRMSFHTWVFSWLVYWLKPNPFVLVS